MLGSPGAGKSMLARRLTTILPAMMLAEAIDTTRMHRVAGLTDGRAALVSWLYYQFCLSYRDVEELLFVRGVIISYEAIRKWCRKFGQSYAH
jgi:predicted ATPase with chaperone activity